MKSFTQINIVTHPHDSKKYRQIFKSAVRTRVKFRGNDFAQISPISKVRNDVFTGVLAMWTEIDQHAGVLNLVEIIEVEFTDSGVVIPRNAGFNPRLFQFSFNVKTHQLYIENKNEKNQTVTPGTVAKAMTKILGAVVDGLDDINELQITVVPTEDAISQVLSVKYIRTIYIKIVRPNPNSQGTAFARVNARMKSENIGVIEEKLTRAKGEKTIKLDKVHNDEVEVASSNGYVAVSGVDSAGERVNKSTKQYPKEIEVEVDNNSSTTATLRAIAS